MNAQQFKKCMSCFPTGVTIVTAKYEEKLFGITINSFNSVSLKPPMILYSLEKITARFGIFFSVENFIVNILSEEQKAISNVFAYNTHKKWEEHFLPNGRIKNSMCSLHCETKHRYDGGDHKIIVAEVVEHYLSDNSEDPLVYYHGNYCKIGDKL